jgi:hypothetical protein
MIVNGQFVSGRILDLALDFFDLPQSVQFLTEIHALTPDYHRV